MSLYTRLIKPVLFQFDPEDVHDIVIFLGSLCGKYAWPRSLLKSLFYYSHPSLHQTILGLHIDHPVGLAAGFDKNAELVDIMPSVGFGHMEVGSVTFMPCAGNPRPRLWRLKQSQGLVVYYGLKNDGAVRIHQRLLGKSHAIPVCVSIAMTNCSENVDIHNAVLDYVNSFKILNDVGDSITINISCPNTCGGQPFMEPDALELLLSALDGVETNKPIFVKLSPDKDNQHVDALLDVLSRHRVHGIICSNLTKKRENKKIVDDGVPAVGGISGKPVQDVSDQLLAYVYKKTQGRYVLVGCGGVFTAEDAYRKIRLGASLIQMITGMIFEGPAVIGKIHRELVVLLQRDGFETISDAIGVDVR